jgi:hypothetical protein
MSNSGEVIITRGGKQFGATYTVSDGMLKFKTHTESRTIALDGGDPDTLARSTLVEIVDAQPQP